MCWINNWANLLPHSDADTGECSSERASWTSKTKAKTKSFCPQEEVAIRGKLGASVVVSHIKILQHSVFRARHIPALRASLRSRGLQGNMSGICIFGGGGYQSGLLGRRILVHSHESISGLGDITAFETAVEPPQVVR